MLEDDNRITGARTPVLTLRGVSAADTGEYFCRVSLGELSLDTLPGTLSITQKPVLVVPEPAELYTFASGAIEYQILAANVPTRFTAQGLPPGLKLDSKTGLITGRPDKPGVYTVTVVASNAAGSSLPATVRVEIASLPPLTTGTYQGLLDRLFFYNGGHGGSILLTVTESGRFSGRVTRGIYSQAVTGRLDIDPVEQIPKATILVPRAAPNAPLELSLVLSEGELEGELVAEGEVGIRVWGYRQFRQSASASQMGRYNLPLRTGQTDAAFPLGTGHVSSTVSNQSVVNGAVRLADGTAFTYSGTPSQGGVFTLHRMLYRNTGSVQGEFTLNRTEPSLEAVLTWRKASQVLGTTRSYVAGFPLHVISGLGRRYLPPLSGQPVLSLPLTANNAALSFSNGGLAVPFTQSLTLGVGNQVSLPMGSGNPHQIRLSINPTTGLITGSGRALDIDPANPALNRQRPGSMSALVIGGENLAEGHFLLADGKGTTSPILSGKVVLSSP